MSDAFDDFFAKAPSQRRARRSGADEASIARIAMSSAALPPMRTARGRLASARLLVAFVQEAGRAPEWTSERRLRARLQSFRHRAEHGTLEQRVAQRLDLGWPGWRGTPPALG